MTLWGVLRPFGRFVVCLLALAFLLTPLARGDEDKPKSGVLIPPGQSSGQDGPRQRPRLRLDANTKRVLDLWAKAYANLKTLHYATTFEYPGTEEEAPTRVKLEYWLKKPNLIRVVVKTPEPKDDGIMVSDGKIIWEYCEEQNLYMQTPVPEGPFMVQGELGGLIHAMPQLFYADNPAPFLTVGVQSIKVSPDEKNKRALLIIRRYPDRTNFIWLDKETYLPIKSTVFALRAGKLKEVFTEVRKEVRVNEEMPDDLFQFTPPLGAKRYIAPKPETLLLKPGVEAPDFEVKDVKGEEVSLASLQGRPVLLTFWASWVPVSMTELKEMEELQTELGDSVSLVAVNSWDEPDALEDYLKEHPNSRMRHWRDTTTRQDRTVAYKLYGVRGLPTTYLLDAEGKVVRSWIGYDKNRAKELHAALKDLLKKKTEEEKEE